MTNLFRKKICLSLSVIFVSAVLALPALIASEANDNRQTIAVYGASGKIGYMITREALARGHRVVGVSRNPDKLSKMLNHDNFTVVKSDVTNSDSFAALAKDVDAIIISVQGNTDGNQPEQSTHAKAAATAVSVLGATDNAPYVLQIGGALTLLESEERMIQNLPFPAEEGSEMHGMFFGHLVALNIYRASNIDWTVLTPPMNILGWSPGGITDEKKLGTYRTTTTGPVKDAEGKNEIYIADLAVAAIEEIENKRYMARRFTVGY